MSRPNKPYLTWQQQMLYFRLHPYNRNNNKLIFTFARLLKKLNPLVDDLDIVRLYTLSMAEKDEYYPQPGSHHDDSVYKKIYAEQWCDVQKWIYQNLATKISSFSKLFDATREISRNKPRWCEREVDALRYWTYDGPINYDVPIELGYTMYIPKSVRTMIIQLLSDIKFSKINLDCPISRQKTIYRLESLLVSMRQAYQRYEAIYMEEVSFHDCKNKIRPTDEVMDVTEITTGLLTLLPVSVLSQKTNNTTEYIAHMSKVYCPEKLKIYSMLLEIMSGLRNINMEGSLRDIRLPYVHQYPGDHLEDDKMAERTSDDSHYKWIYHLPSYRPEFIITLDNFTQFRYNVKIDEHVGDCDCSLQYLKAVNVFYRNFTIPEDNE